VLLMGIAGLGVAGALVSALRPPAGLGLLAWVRAARRLPETGGVRQQRGNDCGPAALAHALRMLGLRVRYPDPDTLLVPGPQGCRLEEIACEAERLGARSSLRKRAPTEIDAVTPPAVLHLAAGHFVTFEGRTPAGGVLLLDPSVGRLEQEPGNLARHWSGWVLELDLPEGRRP
jgi:ABC-type bacteriocin/lantibiotic exporter with double-glycine peptidase domain